MLGALKSSLAKKNTAHLNLPISVAEDATMLVNLVGDIKEHRQI